MSVDGIIRTNYERRDVNGKIVISAPTGPAIKPPDWIGPAIRK